jgi:hypothetical protein
MSQETYIDRSLKTPNLDSVQTSNTPIPLKCKELFDNGHSELRKDPTPYHQAAGPLNDLTQSTRPDLSFALSILAKTCKLLESPTETP